MEVIKQAGNRAISEATLKRAKVIAGVRKRKSKDGWYMWISEEQKEIIKESISAYKFKAGISSKECEHSPLAISSDWIKVETVESAPIHQDSKTNLHIKAGEYEIKADAEFPMEKLTELLRLLRGGEAVF